MKPNKSLIKLVRVAKVPGTWTPHRSCGRVQEAAPQLCPSGNSDTLPARTQVGSGWTVAQRSTLPGDRNRARMSREESWGLKTMSWCRLRFSECAPWSPLRSSGRFPSTWPCPGLLRMSWPEQSLENHSVKQVIKEHISWSYVLLTNTLDTSKTDLPSDCWRHFCWQKLSPHNRVGALIRILVNLRETAVRLLDW